MNVSAVDQRGTEPTEVAREHGESRLCAAFAFERQYRFVIRAADAQSTLILRVVLAIDLIDCPKQLGFFAIA